MSLYVFVLIMLVVFSVYEFFQKEKQIQLYWVAFSVMAAMLCLRYAQGSDYYGYMYNYLVTPRLTEMDALFNSSIHGEPGWLLLCSVLRTLHVPFWLLVVVISAIEMYLLHRFIYKYSPLKVVSLLVAYPTLYLTYAFSALRQGLAILIFLGLMLDWLKERKSVRYLVTALLCTQLHSSALVFLLPLAIQYIPPKYKLFPIDTKRALIYMGLCVAGGLCFSWLIPRLSPSLAPYAESSMSIMAVGERFVSTAMILLVFHDELDGRGTCKNPMLKIMLQVYLYGSIVYAFLFWNALISARMTIFFKLVEVVLFAVAMTKPGKLRYPVAVYIFGLAIVIGLKNIESYISQGGYFDWVNVFNYPYLWLFDQEAVETYRNIPYDFSILPP